MHFACVLNTKLTKMPILQIRNLSDEVYQKLKKSASLNHRSLAQEAVSMLEFAIENKTTEDNKKRRLIVAKKIHKLKKTAVSLEEISDSLRNDRDR